MDNRCNIKSNKSYESSKKSCSYGREKIKIVNKRKTTINNSDILSSKAAISCNIKEDNCCSIIYSLENYEIEFIDVINKEIKNFENKENSLLYENDVFSFEYKVKDNEVKELIYIKQRSEKYLFKYIINVKDLYIEQIDNHLLFKRYDNTILFVSPLLLMYDQDNNVSRDFNISLFKISEYEYELEVLPNKERINQDSRSFPVVIDPTIISYESEHVFRQQFYDNNLEDWVDDEYQTNYFYIDEHSRLCIDFDLSDYDFNPSGVVDARLFLLNSFNGQYYINDKITNIGDAGGIDITDIIRTNKRFILIVEYYNADGYVYLDPGMEILEITYEHVDTLTKLINLNNKFCFINYLRSGDNKIIFNDILFDSGAINLNIFHIFDVESASSFGKGRRLNLNQKLNLRSNYYEYYDEFGSLELLLKKYYIFDGQSKILIDERDVEVDENLHLTTVFNNKIYDVNYEYSSNKGIKLIGNLEGINGSQYLEQRNEEQVKLESNIKNQENYFLNLIAIDRSQENNSNYNYGYRRFNDLSQFFDYIEHNKYRQYIICPNQEIRTAEQWTSLDNEIKDSYSNNYNYSIKKAIEDIKSYKQNLSKIKELYLETPINFLIFGNYIYGFNKYGNLCQIFDQYENYINIKRSEINTAFGKKEIISSVGNANIAISLEYNYFNQLTSIFDSRGNLITYKYFSTLSDSNLYEISDNKGNLVRFNYINNLIDTIKVNNGYLFKFNYFNNLVLSVDTYNYFHKIDSNTAFLSGHDLNNFNILNSYQVDSVSFFKSQNEYKIIQDNKQDRYIIGENDGEVVLISGYQNEVDKIEISKIVENNYKLIIEPKKTQDILVNSLNQNVMDLLGDFSINLSSISTAYSSFNDSKYELLLLDDFNRVYRKESNVELISNKNNGTHFRKEIIEYFYNYGLYFDKYDKEVKTVYLSNSYSFENSEIIRFITEYEYNGNILIKKEEYSLNNLLEEGKNITEYQYDKKGNLIKEISYNTNNATSKFYKEKVYDDNNRLVEEVDELGLYKSTYEYKNNILIARKNYGESFFSEAYDENNNLTSLNQSAEDGNPNQSNYKYNINCLTNAQNGDISINYEYDHKGRTTKIAINDIEYEYEFKGKSYDDFPIDFNDLTNSYQVSEIRGNNRFDSFYDLKTNNLLLYKENNNPVIENNYSQKNQLVLTKDFVSQINKTYIYNIFDQLESVIYKTDTNSIVLSENFLYNEDGILEEKNFSGLINQTYRYHYLNHEKLSKIELPNNYDYYINIDSNGRFIGSEIRKNNNLIFLNRISYLSAGDHTSSYPSSMTFKEYDNNFNLVRIDIDNYAYYENKLIKSCYKNKNLINRFKYDVLGRLIREDNINLNQTFIHFYDNENNIILTNTYDLTFVENITDSENSSIKYLYDKGKLVRVNDNNITYDNFGNPLIYKNNSLVWDKNKKLIRYGQVTFNYDGEGKRICKNNIDYFYDSEGNLIRQSDGSTTLEFIYENSSLFGFKFNGTEYFYKKNIFEDIEEIINLSTNEVVAKYIYDAWGNHIILDNNDDEITDLNTPGVINPFRYRSYYFDFETSLYWLNNRYYDAYTHRFISIDNSKNLVYDQIHGLNLYSYCQNNPVNYIDPTGNLTLFALGIIFVIASFAVSFGSSVVSQGLNYGWNKINYLQATTDGLFSTISMAISFTGIGAIASGIVGAGLSFAQYALNSAYRNKDITLFGSLKAIISGAILGFVGGGGARNTKNIVNNLRLSSAGNKAIKAITTASNKLISKEISFKGFQGTLNLYAKTASLEIQKAMESFIFKEMVKNFSTDIISSLSPVVIALLYGAH